MSFPSNISPSTGVQPGGVTTIVPQDMQLDGASKIRVSTPQSLIDTDFEYGLQPTKWEFINLTNNKPTAFYNSTNPITITGISITSGTVTVTSTANPAVGTPVYVQGATDTQANGWFIVTTTSGTNFTYAQLPTTVDATSGSIYDSTKTYVYLGTFYTGSSIPVSASAGAAFTNVGTTVTATTTYAHGLSIGNLIYVIGTTASTNAPNGMFQIATVSTTNTFTFTVAAAPTGTITASAGATSTLYPTPGGISIHRAYDGGIQFSAGSGQPNTQIIRQTRRYFRYQSGKAIQISTGTVMKGNLYLDSITAVGATATASGKFPHYLTPGEYVQVSGATPNLYNGVFQIASVPTPTSLTFTLPAVPPQLTASGFPIIVSSYSWYGALQRVGIFDQQNGAFFQFDGQTLSVVKRFSTQQVSGLLSVTSGSNTVTGTNSLFAQQLNPNDFLVIRGQSYRVTQVLSNTSLLISPEYRAATAANLVGSKTIDLIIPQSQWNLDPCDGTGPSGYKIDLTKSQMWYIDYAWYGSGLIRWGLRTTNGTIVYVNRMQNNNVNTEAWARSGNLPAHYENTSFGPTTLINTSVGTSDTTIYVASTVGFPPSGTLKLTTPSNSGAIEYISYTGLQTGAFTGCTRGVAGGSAATAFTYSATALVPVELANTAANTTNPFPGPGTLSHWGTSVVMDGGFNNDLQFAFNGGMSSALSVAASAKNALVSLRLGPSVDTGLTGVLGAREIINRMQLKLQFIRLLSTGVFRIDVILNGQLSAGTFAAVGGSSLAQICYHAAATTVSGGESIFSFFTNNSGGSTNSTLTEEDLTLIRDLGNSILGGGLNNTVPTTVNGEYPDGPDIVTLVATNLSSSTASTIQGLVSWTEAQA